MNGRLYDPVLRSFLMPDNFIQQTENTQNYNRYAYVLNNPLMYTDPSGEEAITYRSSGYNWCCNCSNNLYPYSFTGRCSF
nr:RHS repeat-associated core domain-containing protein [Flavobacterium hibisci]